MPTPIYAPMSSQYGPRPSGVSQTFPAAHTAVHAHACSPPETQQCLAAPPSWTQLPDHVLAALHGEAPRSSGSSGVGMPDDPCCQPAKRQCLSPPRDDGSCDTGLRLPLQMQAGGCLDASQAASWLTGSWGGVNSARAAGAPSPLSQLFEYEMSAADGAGSCNAWGQPLMGGMKMESYGGRVPGAPGLGAAGAAVRPQPTNDVPAYMQPLPLLGLHIPPIHTGGMGLSGLDGSSARANGYLPTFDSIMASLCSPRM